MQKTLPVLDKILMHRLLLNEHCQKTGYTLSEANVNTLLALAILTEQPNEKVTFIDVHAFLKKNGNPYVYPIVKDHLDKVLSFGFAKKDEKDRYRITSKGKKWLTEFDNHIELATVQKYVPGKK